MAARPRKRLSPRSKKFEVRFAIRLRQRLAELGLGPSEFTEMLRAAGVDVTVEAVKKWLSGDHVPRPADAETIGRVLELDDYRQVWPDPN